MAAELLLLAAEDVDALLDLETVVTSQRDAFFSLARGTSRLGERVVLDGPEGSATFCYVTEPSRPNGLTATGVSRPRPPCRRDRADAGHLHLAPLPFGDDLASTGGPSDRRQTHVLYGNNPARPRTPRHTPHRA
jgi:hypothetical protein